MIQRRFYIDTKPSTVTGGPVCFSADAMAMSYKASRAQVLAIVQTPAGTKVVLLCCCWISRTVAEQVAAIAM